MQKINRVFFTKKNIAKIIRDKEYTFAITVAICTECGEEMSIQGLIDKNVEDCRAWLHGPVYPEVYDLFRDFKYNPIDDARFALLKGTTDALTTEEKKLLIWLPILLACMVEKFWREYA